MGVFFNSRSFVLQYRRDRGVYEHLDRKLRRDDEVNNIGHPIGWPGKEESMARSYIRSRRGRKGGILVREAAVARGVPTNSLYSVPVVGSQATAGNAVTMTYTAQGTIYTLNIGGKSVVVKNSSGVQNAVIRASSMTVASKSPFLLKVLNSSGGYTTYEIQGQKPTKITFSRETSILGNPALFKAFYATGTTFAPLVVTDDQEDAVDIKVNLVIDSAFDN